MKKSNNGFWLIIWIWLVFLISMLVLYIIEYMIPFSRNIKWVENSSISYYQAVSWFENALYSLKKNNFTAWTETWTTLSGDNISWSFEVKAMWNILPPVWEGDSDFDENWNKISVWSPIQLQIWKWFLEFSPFFAVWKSLIFRVPDLNWIATVDQTLSWWILPLINWQLSSEDDTLNSRNESAMISANEICSSNKDSAGCESFMWGNRYYSWRLWKTLDWTDEVLNQFQQDNCQGTNSWCILKFSIINKLELTNWVDVPYLEWNFQSNQPLPLRFSTIIMTWKSYWFKRVLQTKISQLTTIEAFDFTVFQ